MDLCHTWNARKEHKDGLQSIRSKSRPRMEKIRKILLVEGTTTLVKSLSIRGWHPLFEHIKHIKHLHRWKALRYSALLAIVGAANAAMSFLYPSALWWGEDQLQVVLTRGCSFASSLSMEHFPLLASQLALVPHTTLHHQNREKRLKRGQLSYWYLNFSSYEFGVSLPGP